MTNKKITTFELLLRELNNYDATKEYCSWLNDKEVNKYLETHKATVESIKEFINKNNNDNNVVLRGIFVDGKHIGNVKVDIKDKVGTIGIMIGNKNYWNKGVGTKAMNAMENELKGDLDKLNLGVKKANIRAIKCYEKCGYKIVGEKNNDGVWMEKKMKKSNYVMHNLT